MRSGAGVFPSLSCGSLRKYQANSRKETPSDGRLGRLGKLYAGTRHDQRAEVQNPSRRLFWRSIPSDACWRKVGNRMKSAWVSFAAAMFTLVSGCQCCPLFDYYANVVDDINDTHLYVDRLYNPRFDLTRMGKPDWCSPLNSHFCRRCCNNGCYDGYDDCNLYPPVTPYNFPSRVMPSPTVRTKRIERKIDVQMTDELNPRLPGEDPLPSPTKSDTPSETKTTPPPRPMP